MARVGRKPQGWKLIERLSGEKESKARLKAFLETLTGECTVPEVCEKLGIKQSRFFVLRNVWLEKALGLLDPKPAGRPRKASPEEPRVVELEQRLHKLEQQLLAAELRARLAEAKTIKPARHERKKGSRR